MTETMATAHEVGHDDPWLKRYYFTRAAFSIVWVSAAFALTASATAIVAALLLVYPAWDAIANLVDAQRNGGLRRNPTQTFNAAVSTVTTVAVAVALAQGMNAVLGVFGVWACLTGLLQLATAVRRWRSSRGQWPMAVSGVQSTAAGVSFVVKATAATIPQITAIAPYAAFGAFYFLVSAVWLVVVDARRGRSGRL